MRRPPVAFEPTATGASQLQRRIAGSSKIADLLANSYDVRHLIVPVRYPPSHKSETRRRILEMASQAFREHGVTETGVDEVMRRAGLTHGGFYAHFRDKEELVAEACAAAFGAAVPNLQRIAALPKPSDRARLLIDSYLSTRHRDNRGDGCFVVAVGADMARLRGKAREGYTRGFTQHLDRLCSALRLNSNADKNRERVTHLMSSLVGALLFARATESATHSETILHSMRRQLRAEFCRNELDDAVSAAQPTSDFLRAT